MIFSREVLDKSLFYPASGTDLEPLVRFSHVVSNYVYTDYSERINAADPEHMPDGLKLVEIGEIQDIPELDVRRSWLRKRTTSPPAALTEQDVEAFREQYRWEDYVRPTLQEIKFLRQVGNQERLLTLYFIRAEGMAAYSDLYLRNGIAPAILCTVRSGASMGGGWSDLGDPAKPFLRLVKKGPLPELWVNGDWYFLMRENEHWYELSREELLALGGVEWGWDHLAQSYPGWRSPDADGNSPAGGGFAPVMAYTNHPLAVPEVTTIDGPHRRVIIRQAPLQPEELGQYDAAFVSAGMRARFQVLAPEAHLFTGTADLANHLANLDDLCIKQQLERVVSAPMGREDEGQLLREWVEADREWPKVLEIRIKHPLDFVDLRCATPLSVLSSENGGVGAVKG